MTAMLTEYSAVLTNNACEQAVYSHAGLKQGGDKTGTHASQHGGRDGQIWMARDGDHRAGRGAERKAAVRRQVAYVQHGIAEEQRQHSKRADEAKLRARSAPGTKQ